MSKAEIIQELAVLSREDLEDVADRVDELRGGACSAQERAVVRDRLAAYRQNPDDVTGLDEAVADILGSRL